MGGAVRLAACLALALLWAGGPAGAAERLRLAAPPGLIAAGLTQHLLPRFGFKTRIRLDAVPAGEPADLALAPQDAAPPGATPVMESRAGVVYAVAALSDDAAARDAASALADWLLSESGRRALEGFEIDGAPAFAALAKAPKARREVALEGDAEEGAKLALTHCGRCHVVDKRNPFGGIGSTPSFGAIRSFPDWKRRFTEFWTQNPHPAFLQIEGVTPPFHPERPPPIKPVHLTRDDADAIAAYASKIPVKDLGARVEAR